MLFTPVVGWTGDSALVPGGEGLGILNHLSIRASPSWLYVHKFSHISIAIYSQPYDKLKASEVGKPLYSLGVYSHSFLCSFNALLMDWKCGKVSPLLLDRYQHSFVMKHLLWKRELEMHPFFLFNSFYLTHFYGFVTQIYLPSKKPFNPNFYAFILGSCRYACPINRSTSCCSCLF